MNVKNLVLGIGIFIVYLLVLNYGIEAFYPAPDYGAYCTNSNYYYPGQYPTKPFPDSTVNCTISPTPQQQDMCMREGGNLVADSYDTNGCPATFACDFCNRDFNEAQKEYSQRVFFISLIVGILTLLAGYAILTLEPVGSSLMASGIGALVYGSMRNWQNLSTIWRFVLLLASLFLLIWIAWRINKRHGKR